LLIAQEHKEELGWQKWYAWKPVVTRRKEEPRYYETERVIWLELVERKWHRDTIYDDWHWIYAPTNQTKEQIVNKQRGTRVPKW